MCQSLDAKLRQAEASLRRDCIKTARRQLEAFLAELEAQHGEEPGKHVNDNAFFLLKTNAEFTLERL